VERAGVRILLSLVPPQWLPHPESLIYGPRRYNYLRQVKKTCDFVASYQVSDSLSSNFGGVIEAEHLPNIIETDNTQEAIWIWSRWYELTGRDDFHENIRRAWIYVKNNPAFRENNGDPNLICTRYGTAGSASWPKPSIGAPMETQVTLPTRHLPQFLPD